MTDNPQSSDPLTPPEPLAPPAPVGAIAPAQAIGRVPVPADDQRTLDDEVLRLAHDLVDLPPESEGFRDRARMLGSLGNDEIVRSSGVANRLLERPTRAMGALGEGAGVSKSLLDLRRTVEQLDPSSHGDLFSPKRFLGMIPMGNKLRDYFRGYESSQSHLNAVIEALRRSRDELLRDNAAIEQEKASLWKLMGDLEKHAYLARRLGDAVEAEVERIRPTDPERARVLTDEILFVARQRHQDLATQMAVNVQGYMALDVIKKNNVELARGIDRATTTTVAALRTAILTAQALGNQQLVLDQVTAVRDTTSNLISSTSRLLRDNASRIQEGATQPTVDVAKLAEAFANVRSAIDGMSTYREKALTSMAQTVNALGDEVGKAKSYLETRRAVTSAPENALGS